MALTAWDGVPSDSGVPGALDAEPHERRPPRGFGAGRRTRARLWLGANVVLAVWIVVVANAIAFRHPGRLDFTEERIHSLSEETKATLALVRERVSIILPIYVEQGNDRYTSEYRVLMRAVELLRVYSLEQPLIQPVQVVDVLTESSRWQGLCSSHELAPTQLNRLVLFAGAGRAFRETVMPGDLARLVPHPSDPTAPAVVQEYFGESALTSALFRLVHRERKQAFFTRGHGELTPGPASRIRELLHDLGASGFDVQAMSLGEVRRVPETCDLLVIAAPQQDFTQDELDVVAEFLDRDGRLLVTLGSERTNLERLLAIWGVEVLGGRVRARTSAIGGRLDTSWVLARSFSPVHPVTEPFAARGGLDVRLFEPRPLRPVTGPHRLESVDLLRTGVSDETIRYYQVGGLGSGGVCGDEGDGNFTLAVATRQPEMARAPEEWVELRTRLVVVAASNFLSDEQPFGFRAASHRELLMNCVHWLTGRESLLVADGVGDVERRVNLRDESLRSLLFYSSVLIFPGIFLCLGVFVYFLRRA